MNLKGLGFQFPIQNLLVVYPVDEGEVLFAFASRKKRKWIIKDIQSSSTDRIPELVARFKSPKKITFMIIAPRSLYFFIRAVYPPGIKNNLANVLQYDREENTLLKNNCFYMASPPLESDTGILAPSLSLRKSSYERLLQPFNTALFSNHITIPDIYLMEAFLKSRKDTTRGDNVWILRECNKSKIAAFQACNGIITESLMINRENHGAFNFFLQKLKNTNHIICIQDSGDILHDLSLNIEVLSIDTQSFFEKALIGLLQKQTVNGFDGTSRFHYPKIPKLLYLPVIGILCLMAAGLYAQTTMEQSKKRLNELIARKNALEQKWAPIEKQMQVIEKLEQDKKTLKDTLKQGIPALEILEVLTKVTPDDTWLTYLVINQNNMIILRGESGSAVKFVSALSKVPGFQNVSFASPVRKNTRTQKEYFNIKLTVNWSEFIKGFSKQAKAK